MSDPSAVSCCPECWLSGKYSMIESSPNKGFVSCPTHGEMTISHFMSRIAEMQEINRNQRNAEPLNCAKPDLYYKGVKLEFTDSTDPEAIFFGKCSCDNPIQGKYICNGDAYRCDNCQGVVSGRQLRIHARK